MHEFDTTTAITTVLDIPAGRVELFAGERPDTTVDVRPADASKGRDVKTAEQTTVELTDGVLRITAPAKNQYFGPSGSVDVTVQLPAGSRVEVKAAAADVRAVGRFGDVAVEATQGTIKIDETSAVRLTTVAGDVTVDRLTGSAEVSTSKGDITIAEARRGKLVLTTQAGDVTVGAATGVSAALDAGTSYGRIDNALRTTEGTPDLQIRATTAYGDIVARSH